MRLKALFTTQLNFEWLLASMALAKNLTLLIYLKCDEMLMRKYVLVNIAIFFKNSPIILINAFEPIVAFFTRDGK